MPRMKDLALRAACAALSAYFRHMPGQLGKMRLWDRIVQRHILWRRMDIEARSLSGARFAGSFPDSVHGFLYFFGVWEPAITAIYQAALRPGDIVVDVGANVGAHALLASRLVGPGGQVHAVEASPWIHERLRGNLTANGIGNVTTYNLAATDKPGQVTVFLHDGTNLGGTTIVPGEAERIGAAREASVEGRPLPEIVPLAALLAARLIKIDVEGAEWLVLQGMREVLPRLDPRAEILLEVNPDALARFGASMEDVLTLFAGAGFQAFEVDNPYDGRFYIEAPRAVLRPLRRPIPAPGPAGTFDLCFRRSR